LALGTAALLGATAIVVGVIAFFAIGLLS